MKTRTHGICDETGKAIYYSEGAAKRDRRNYSRGMRAYRCEFHHGHLHLTSQWKRKQPTRKERAGRGNL